MSAGTTLETTTNFSIQLAMPANSAILMYQQKKYNLDDLLEIAVLTALEFRHISTESHVLIGRWLRLHATPIP